MAIDEDRLVKTLQSLVRIPSFKDSLAISRWVRGEMEGIGFKVDSDSDGNLIAEIGEGPGFILNAHMDTVGLGDGWKHDPLEGVIEDGKLYGRGASDMKAGIAAMMEIARILKEEGLKKRVVFTFTAFEEGYPIEQNGVYKILPKLKDIEKGLSLEPTTHGDTIDIAVGCRGSSFYQVEILGDRGHSSRPEGSDNPIYRFPAFLGEVKEFPVRKMNVPIINQKINDQVVVTEICAEEGINVIPATCRITLDRRSLPDEEPGSVDGKLKNLCKKVCGKKFRLESKSSVKGYSYEDKELLGICKDAVRSVGMKPMPYFEVARYDGCILSNFAGIGVFMMGPGSIHQGHSIDEHCDLKGMFKATEAILEVIRKWDMGN